jgi:hypothetical protein
MEAVPLKTLLFDYVEERANGLATPYGQFLRANVVIRLVYLARRRKKDFEMWKQQQGKVPQTDEEIVEQSLDNQDVAFFEWLCTGVHNIEAARDDARTRFRAWADAKTPENNRLRGKFFMKYLVEQRL